MADGRTEHVVVSGGLSADSVEMVARAVLAGLGVGHLSRFVVEEHIARGALIELFPESRVVDSHIYAVYPERRNLALKTRAFIDHLKAEFLLTSRVGEVRRHARHLGQTFVQTPTSRTGKFFAFGTRLVPPL